MEWFHRAKAVRLRSQHNKYMIADEDEDTVKQSRNGSSKSARWAVESVDGNPNLIRLKSCLSWKYLSASDDPFLLGMTGKRVVQASPRLRLDPSVEWEPIKEGGGSLVKLRTRKGNFLRANGGIPPWMNSITHDLPSRTSSHDWILWTVDVLEVDYQSNSTAAARPNSYEGSVSTMKEAEATPTISVPSSVSNVPPDSLSRNSSSSLASTMEDYKDYFEVESPAPEPARSARSEVEIPASASAKSTGVSPFNQHMHNDSMHSNSFNKLKSMLDGVQDLLDDSEEVNSSSNPHPVEVQMAKQTLKEFNNMDFNEILSTGRENKLEKAINILVAEAKTLPQPQIPKDLAKLQDQLNSMKNDHKSASRDLIDYTTFSTRRLETKAGLKKDAAKAHELETLEAGFNNMLITARAKREELLKQLEEVENGIKAAESAQIDTTAQIDELISSIGQKSESLRDMERMESSWKVRKFEAQSTLERVEEDWVYVKSLLQDL